MDLSFNQTSMDLRERFFSLLDSLSALRAMSQINLEEISEEALIDRALGELIRYQNVEHCSVFRLQEGRLRCIAGTSMSESHDKLIGAEVRRTRQAAMEFALGEGIAGVAYASGQLQYCRDCSQNKDFILNPVCGIERPGSLVSVPIKMGNEVLAVLNASHPLPEFFEPWQQHTLSLFCCCLGQILHNHRMLHDLEAAVAQRTRELRTALHEAESLQKRYEQLSSIDELTGLHNRRYFFAEAKSMLSRARRHSHSCSLMLLDIDYFKQINDRWGHVLGDKALCAIADVLRQETRGGDLVARVGGEEFVIMLPESGIEGANLMAQRIQERFALFEFGKGVGNLHVTATIGITAYRPEQEQALSDSELADLLYSQADSAMYEGKREGRNIRKTFRMDPSS